MVSQCSCVSHIVISLSYQPACVKNVCTHTPLSRVLYFCIISWWSRNFLFLPAPFSILLYLHKRGCGFLATMSVGSKIARVSPPSKRIDNAELFCDKLPQNDVTHCSDFSACFSCTKIRQVKPRGMTV